MGKREGIGFWHNDKGYLSGPIGFVDGKAIRIRIIKNRYASKEKNTPTYIGYIGGEGITDSDIIKSIFCPDGDKALLSENDVQDIINAVAYAIGGDRDYGMWLVSDFMNWERVCQESYQ